MHILNRSLHLLFKILKTPHQLRMVLKTRLPSISVMILLKPRLGLQSNR
ncbi:unnamed protein product [Moneuplotes crassus]|uniref:Uncharacterized protein n=1 Tax=Euplotes crassus TaxID=5936 RepID=A0AAD1XSL1_EUPCR|nr:unnamed protein product [Moneuplotes crassus]